MRIDECVSPSPNVTAVLSYYGWGQFPATLGLAEAIIGAGGRVAVVSREAAHYGANPGGIDPAAAAGLYAVQGDPNEDLVADAEEWLHAGPARHRLLLVEPYVMWDDTWTTTVTGVIDGAFACTTRGVHVFLLLHGSNALERDPGPLLRCDQLWLFGSHSQRPRPESLLQRLGPSGASALSNLLPPPAQGGAISFLRNVGPGHTVTSTLLRRPAHSPAPAGEVMPRKLWPS